MPQLNPDPWFAILVFSWTVFLVIIPPKVLAHAYPNEPTTQAAQKPNTNPWSWQWH